MADTLISLEPATGATLWEGGLSDVDAEIARVERSWPSWAATSFAYRVEAMRRFVNRVRGAGDALTELIARETGKPLWEAQNELAALISGVEDAIRASSDRTGQRRLDGALGQRQALRHKPHGALAVVTPHVLPAQIPAGHIVPALLAGNGVLLKPSEKTPATAERLVHLFHEAGVPEDLLRPVFGGPDIGEALVADERVRAILFTGASRSGIAIARACAPSPEKSVALQLGGNNPLVVWEGADIAMAAALTVQAAFAASGQHCRAARRLIVSKGIADALLDEIIRLTDRLIIDHPHSDPAPFMGPVIDMDAADALTEGLVYLMSHGGHPLRHMQRPFAGLPFVTPAIIDVTEMAERPDIELFGPLLQVIRVNSFDGAIAEANNSRYGLAASLIGGKPEQYDQFWSNSRAGIVNWNRPTTSVTTTGPIGGVGLSGNHRPGGYHNADNCAYPVASVETERLRAAIGIGLKPSEPVPLAS